jgi:hypothetical protein
MSDTVKVKLTGSIELQVLLHGTEITMERGESDQIKNLIKMKDYAAVQLRLSEAVMEQHAHEVLDMIGEPDPNIDDIEIDGELLDWEAE